MAKLLFAVAWAAALVGLAVRNRPPRLLPALQGLGRGLRWGEDTGVGSLALTDQVLLWLGHAGGLAYLWRLAGWSYGAAIPLGLVSAAVLVLPQWPALLRTKRLEATPLTPLVAPYIAAALRALGVLPANSLLTLVFPLALGAAAYSLLVQVERRWSGLPGTAIPTLPALLLLAGTAGWAVVEYLGGRTRGVTGSDPYCYVQMAVDLARRGDPRHFFSLFLKISDLGIPWWPIAHVGYYPPVDASSLAATVWPVGWPAVLAPAYRLFGESALYLGAPVAGLLALAATAALALEVWRGGGARERWLGVALAVLILATSQEQTLWLLVPMADVPTQLCTVLAVWLALRARRQGSWRLAALAGGAMGMAYEMRHTQLFLAPALAVALWPARGKGRRWSLPVAAAAAASLIAVPDLWYHRVAFGSFWRPESPEMSLIGLSHWWGNARRMAAAMAAWPEFGLLLPLLAFGAWRLWREERRSAAALFTWVAATAGAQFLYGPLRWRDLLSIAPGLAILSAYGSVGLIKRLRPAMQRGATAPSWAALGLALLLAGRSATAIRWAFQPGEVTFGYMTTEQRLAFDLLRQSTEEGAVIGTALNSGAVELYSGREAFRAGDWSTAELETFFGAMSRAGKPVYLLDDGNEQASVIEQLRAEGRLVPVRVLGVPLYGDPKALTGTLYRLR